MDEQQVRRQHLARAIRAIGCGSWDRFARALKRVDGASPYDGEDIRRRVDGEVRIDNEFVHYVARTSGLSRRFLAGNQDDLIIEYGTLLRFDLKDIP